MNRGRKRVVITGMGLMSPLGETVDEYWQSLLKGKSGVGPMTLVDPAEYPCKVSGEVSNFDPGQYVNPKEAKRMARFSQLAVAAAAVAVEDANLDLSKENSERLGVVMGNGIGGFPTTEDNARVIFEKGGMKASPFFIPMILPNMAAANVSRLYHLKGYTSTIITACAAGNQAIGEAAEAIRRGAADVLLAGACEAGICQLGLGGFNVIRSLTRNNEPPEGASRPFDANRDGFVPAGGAEPALRTAPTRSRKRRSNSARARGSACSRSFASTTAASCGGNSPSQNRRISLAVGALLMTSRTSSWPKT